MSSVTLDFAKFQADYPKFSNITSDQFDFLSKQVIMYLDNTDNSVVDDLVARENMLYLLVAHLAYLFYGDASGNGGAGAVGRVSSAREGSVEVDMDIGNMPFNAAFFSQTPYGFMFWQMTKPYRVPVYYGCE